MKDKELAFWLNVIGVIGITIIVGFILNFTLIDPYQDEKAIAKSVCEDIGKEMTDRNKGFEQVCGSSNLTSSCFNKRIYQVECEDEIIKYIQYRHVRWENEDCTQRNKWGECKILKTPKRIKYLDYAIQDSTEDKNGN